MKTRTQIIKALILALGLSLVAISARALDYPHTNYPSTLTNIINCGDCHFSHGAPPWDTSPNNIDETFYNNLCWTCHEGVIATDVKTHSSLQTDNSYGDWTIQCWECHDPHAHEQPDAYIPDSYLDSGTSEAITDLNQITKTGAGWDDTGSGEFAGMMVIPDTSNDYYVYQITGNTTDTLTVLGPMNLTLGNTYDFAIFYGRLVRSTIDAPDLSTCSVVANEFICVEGDYTSMTARFFRNTGTKSFADGDATYDGVCEVCHTQTNYHKDDGTGASHNAGVNCTTCHAHLDGFKGVGDCVTCHSSPQGPRRAVILEFNASIGHLAYDVSAADNATLEDDCTECHTEPLANHTDGTLDNPFAGTFGDSAYCLNCHDSTTPAPFTGGESPAIAAPDVNTPWTYSFNHSTGAVCLDCHGKGDGMDSAHGSTVQGMLKYGPEQYDTCFQAGCHNATISKTDLSSEQDADSINSTTVYQNNWNTIPNIQGQFATSNDAYHPVLGVGKNQPANSLNSVWDSSSYRKDDTAPGGPFDGLDNNFVDGWTASSLMTCTDCHDNAGSGASGPHGSSYLWILKGVDTSVTVTTAGSGTLQPNSNVTANDWHQRNFCINCHRGDVYGYGSRSNNGPSYNNETFSRINHRGGEMRTRCTASDLETGKGGYRYIGCLNCHSGGEVTGIHGTSAGIGTAGSDSQGPRFMNGNSWKGYTKITTGGVTSCYTGTPPAIGVNMSSCSGQHGGGRGGVQANYPY